MRIITAPTTRALIWRDEDWRRLWEERTGESYPWPGKRKADSSVNGVDTLPKTPYVNSIGSFG